MAKGVLLQNQGNNGLISLILLEPSSPFQCKEILKMVSFNMIKPMKKVCIFWIMRYNLFDNNKTKIVVQRKSEISKYEYFSY